MKRRMTFARTAISMLIMFVPTESIPTMEHSAGTGDAFPYYDLVADTRESAEGDEGASVTVVIVSGIHGDERSGPLAAHRLAEELTLQQGRLVIVPVVNGAAHEMGTRRAPGQGDLNRSFGDGVPGFPEDPATALAASLVRFIEKQRPVVVLDFHESNGAWTETTGPAVVLPPSGTGSETVLTLLETPVLAEFGFTGSPPEGSLVRELDRRGIPAYIVEVPREYPLERRIQALNRLTVALLEHLGMVSRRGIR